MMLSCWFALTSAVMQPMALTLQIERNRSHRTAARHALRTTTHAALATTHTDHLDRSLSAHRRGTLRGMDAA
ncbi:hypothetical protein DGN21_07225 [Xanthomonas sp. MLO165]|nr:hypothetical protein DGN21_07225 [Xanthomonas sp. MLO165]